MLFHPCKDTRNESSVHHCSHKSAQVCCVKTMVYENSTITENPTSHIFPNLVPPTLCGVTLTLCGVTLCGGIGGTTRWHKVQANWRTAIHLLRHLYTMIVLMRTCASHASSKAEPSKSDADNRPTKGQHSSSGNSYALLGDISSIVRV